MSWQSHSPTSKHDKATLDQTVYNVMLNGQ